MSKKEPLFKPWVPEWFIYLSIFFLLFTTVLLFAISTAEGSAAAGYYGASPADVQFSMLVFYSAVASFAAIERRFFERIVTKDYLLICVLFQIVVTFCCYHAHKIGFVFVFRFMQGLGYCCLTSISLNLLFGKLKSEHAREIGYTVFFALILCVSPITGLIASPLFENYEYNVVYKAIIFCFVPGAAVLFVLIRRVHLVDRKPLYQLDWSSFILFVSMLILIAYILAYGQEKDWFDDYRIVISSIAILFLILLSVLRQAALKRPTVNLNVFKYRNFLVGIVFLAVFYLLRGGFALATSYFINILGMDAQQANMLMIYSVLGVIAGSITAVYFITHQYRLRFLWMAGFTLILSYYVGMCYLFATEADKEHFFLLLFLQGLGSGMVMSPIIMFMISSVPDYLSSSATAVGVFVRFLSFGIGLALVNFFQLYDKGRHYNVMAQRLSFLDLKMVERLNDYQGLLASRGMPKNEAAKAAALMLSKTLQKQEFLLFCVNYHQLMAILCLGAIIAISLQPMISRTMINLKGKQPAAVGF